MKKGFYYLTLVIAIIFWIAVVIVAIHFIQKFW